MHNPMVCRYAGVLILLPLLFLAGCQREESGTSSAAPLALAPATFQLITLDLGNSIGADRRVVASATSFAPGDTIYASVIGKGSAGLSLKARWSYQNSQVVSESSQNLMAPEISVVEFHIAKPTGWPKGRYKVEILANGAPVGAREFEVR